MRFYYICKNIVNPILLLTYFDKLLFAGATNYMNSIRTHYLICNERDTDWGIYATTTGTTSYPPNSVYPHTYHPPLYYFNPLKGRIIDEFMLVYITKGSGVLKTENSTEITIAEGDLFLIKPREWHSYKPNSATGWDEYWIGFRGDYFNTIFEKEFLKASNPLWKTGVNSELVGWFEKAISIANEQQPGYQQVLSGIILQIISFGYYLSQRHLQDNYAIQCINKAKTIMIQHIEEPIHPAHIAEMLHVSYSWLRSNFKTITHFSPSAYQQELKIERSKVLLINSDMSIKEIASSLNFSSPANFTTVFKTKVGITPAEYKNR